MSSGELCRLPGDYTLLIQRRPFSDYQNAEPITTQTIRVEHGMQQAGFADVKPVARKYSYVLES
jgi:hypothetical protein